MFSSNSEPSDVGPERLHAFHWADYVLFGATIAMSSAIGIYFACSGGKQKTTAEFLLGNRKQKIGPVAMSLIVSFESSISMLGYPAEMYAYGTQYWTSLIGYFFCCMLISQTFVPLMYPLKLTSSFEYLDLRFKSRTVRLLASILGVISNSWYMGIVLYGPATALEAVVGFPMAYSILLISIAAVFYTTMGGIKAVIWSDALQFIVMLLGILAVVIKGSMSVGGVGKVFDYCDKGGRLQLFDFNIDPRTRHTFWNLILGGTIRALGLGVGQTTVQRISSMNSLNAAKIVMMLTFPGFFLFSSLAFSQGLIAYAYFEHTECDPFGAKIVRNPNQILPYFVMELFQNHPGLPGLFLASLFSASLSTLSSGLSGMSGVVWNDFLKPCVPKVSEFTATLITKAAVFVLGCSGVGVAFLVMLIGGPLNQIAGTILGSISGPLTGLFVLGSLFPTATAKGAVSGATIAFAVVMWLAMGASFSPLKVKTPYLPPASIDKCFAFNTSAADEFRTWSSRSYEADMEFGATETVPMSAIELSTADSILSYFYSISYMWFSPIGMLLTVMFGLAISHVTGANPPGTVDPKYIIPVFDNLFCYLPRSLRDKLRYGKDFVEKDETKEEDLYVNKDGGEYFLLIQPTKIEVKTVRCKQ